MQKLSNLLTNWPHRYITDSDLCAISSSSADSRYGQVKRMLAQGKLLRIKRGLYCLSEDLRNKVKPHPFELAQWVYGPSYISLESALSFHQLIPEVVYTTTSVSIKRSKEFSTSLSVFSYAHIPLENFYIQVELIKENAYQFLMAKPWKAICDYIYCYKHDWNSVKPLAENLRIDIDNLPVLSREEIEELNDFYHHARIKRFLKGITR